MNMFHDEYECVATCIFSARAGDIDYHNLNAIVESEEMTEESTIPYDDVDNSTMSSNDTSTVSDDGNSAAVTGGTTDPTATAVS